MSDSDSEFGDKEVVVKRNSSSESSYDEEEVPAPEHAPGEQKQKETTLVETYGEETTKKMTTAPPLRRKRFIPKYDVDGVYKLALSEETQAQINLVIGVNVTSQYPWTTVKKDKILECIDMTGENSEFFSLKSELEDYEEDTVFMGYIVDETRDFDEFYICCTKEAREHCKEQSDRFIRRQQQKLQKAVQKKPRPWNSLGSEVELYELLPVNKRPLMELEIKSKFPSDYQVEKFSVRDSEASRDGILELTPYRQKFNLVFRRRVDNATQVAPPKVECEAQTDLRYPQNMWTQSIADALAKIKDSGAGGDTTRGIGEDGEELDEDKSSSEDENKEVLDEVGIASYREAFTRMRRQSYIRSLNKFMSTIKNRVDSVVELNTVMDIYCNDYPNLVAEKAVDIYDSMIFDEYICFTDVRAKDKYISDGLFHPMWTGVVAISYADDSPCAMTSLGTRRDPIRRAVYGLNPVMIWSHTDTLFPKLYLVSPREIKVLSWCPFNENILIGGCVNGQIVIWDLTNKFENVEKIDILSETREKYRIAMGAHMGWMKNVHDKSVVESTALSNLLNSHYGPVTAINWLSPNFIVTPTGRMEMMPEGKKSLMIFTGSEDGTILIWNLSLELVTFIELKKTKKSKRVQVRPAGLLEDTSPFKILDRNLQPCYKIILGIAGQPRISPLQTFSKNYPEIIYTYTPTVKGTGRKYFKSQIIPENEDQISKVLYCGSMHGEVLKISWDGHDFNTGEVINSEYCNLVSCNLHDGVVVTTTKNPFIPQITLTVGGKIFAIWSDDLIGRPLIWKKRTHRLTDGSWSLYKPSLLFLTTAEGTLESWDFFLRSDQPISVQTLSGTTLTGISIHPLPLTKNIVGVSDANGAYKMYLVPPIFMIQNPSYVSRMISVLHRELRVMKKFTKWQNDWMKSNPDVIEEIKRKEGILLSVKEEERCRLREEEDNRLDEEAEAKRQEKIRIVGPEERWQMIVQKLIEKTIAVKKMINRAELIEQEKPLRELEVQRLEKERRMLGIMRKQKTIFNDTVAILFPEAIKKNDKDKKGGFDINNDIRKKKYLADYESLKKTSAKMVEENLYKIYFSWESTLAEGKERRQALTAHQDFIIMHKSRLDTEGPGSGLGVGVTSEKFLKEEGPDECRDDKSAERDMSE